MSLLRVIRLGACALFLSAVFLGTVNHTGAADDKIDVFDRSSFLAKAYAREIMTGHLRDRRDRGGEDEAALGPLLDATFLLAPSAELAQLVALYWHDEKMYDTAVPWFNRALLLDRNNEVSLRYLGLYLHQSGHSALAVGYFERLLALDPRHDQNTYLLALALQHAGDIKQSAEMYSRCLLLRPSYNRARLNLATLQHRYGQLKVALYHYEILLGHWKADRGKIDLDNEEDDEEYVMVMLNYAVGLLQNGYHETAAATLGVLRADLDKRIIEYDCTRLLRVGSGSSVSLYCDRWVSALDMAGSHLMAVQRGACDWHMLEERTQESLMRAMKKIKEKKEVTTLLPFDTLMLPVSLADRLIVAAAHSSFIRPPLSVSEVTDHDQDDRDDGGAVDIGLPATSSESDRGDENTDTGNIITNSWDSIIGSEDREDDITDTGSKIAARGRPPSVGDNIVERGGIIGLGGRPSSPRSLTLGGKIMGGRSLTLGFFSHDFNDHPTGHMVEAIFKVLNDYWNGERKGEVCSLEARDASSKVESCCSIEGDIVTGHSQSNGDPSGRGSSGRGHRGHNDSRGAPRSVLSGDIGASRSVLRGVSVVAFSFGKQDLSTYRLNIEQLADRFVDLALMSYVRAAVTVRAAKVDVLLDMQGHTLGGRMEIIAGRPANIQVNYLVFPGTSGATFLDYLLADKVVVPPEHAIHYSESLLLLPPTYQISYFDRHVSGTDGRQRDEVKMELRRQYGLPLSPSAFVLCNFNKVDKLDRGTLSLWLAIMRRTPRTFLWLLRPSRSRGEDDTFNATNHNTLVERNILRAAAAEGVSPRRIFFADRESKGKHIPRHLAADLFLDSLGYGAHSTATDALKGGVPVLTLKGGSFPNRVAASLYASMPSTPHTLNTPHTQHTQLGGGECSSPVSSVLVRHTLRDLEDFAVNLINTASSSASSFSSSSSSSSTSYPSSPSSSPGLSTSPPSPSSTFPSSSSSSTATTTASPSPSPSSLSPSVLSTLQSLIFTLSHERRGLFDTLKGVEVFLYGMQAVQEVKGIKGRMKGRVKERIKRTKERMRMEGVEGMKERMRMEGVKGMEGDRIEYDGTGQDGFEGVDEAPHTAYGGRDGGYGGRVRNNTRDLPHIAVTLL